MEPNTPSESDEISLDNLVPSTRAYFSAWVALFISGVTGGFIGYSMMVVFAPGIGGFGRAIGTIAITVGIIFSMSILTTLGLRASVEWKARSNSTSRRGRPSRLIN